MKARVIIPEKTVFLAEAVPGGIYTHKGSNYLCLEPTGSAPCRRVLTNIESWKVEYFPPTTIIIPVGRLEVSE